MDPSFGKPRIRRKSSAIKVLSRSNTFSSSTTGDETDPDANSTANHSVPNLPTGSLSAALDNLRRTVQKRITTWAYLRSAHQGHVFWFNTVLLSKEELSLAFEHSKMRIRTTRFAVLGMSLSSLLDISSAHDFLRGLLSLLQEFDSVTDDKFDLDRKNRGVFRVSSRPKRSGGGGADLSMGLQDSGEASYLLTPNIPFELDYFQVLYTTCDLLVETYTKILSYLGPAHLSVPGGGGGFPQPPGSYASSINSGSVIDRNSVSVSTLSSSTAAGLSPALTDVVLKIDTRLMKIVGSITKDVDGVARKSIKSELESLAGSDWGAGLDAGVGPNDSA
ncbi:hypothetical protein T439DRAFT_310695 [Meredithblackwellia eburnea MCA 4105]